MDNVKLHEPLGNSDHNQVHFDINVKSESKNKKMYRRNFHKGNYKDMRKYLTKLDLNNMLRNTTATLIASFRFRQSKRSYEQKLACNIKNDSKSFYAYVRSKQNVRDKVGPLEDSAGNIISQGFLMVKDLNGYFSSVFTREDISSLPVPDAKFQEVKSYYLGQLIVTPEKVGKKMKAMEENKGNER